jgi:Protein of unknown function (DUF3179)
MVSESSLCLILSPVVAVILRSMNRGFARKPLLWLTVCALLSFLVLAYPLYVIRPFRYQGSRELAVALAVMRFRPFLEIVFSIAALALLVFCWRRLRGVWRKLAASACTLLIIAFGVLSRVNVYELMFHPLDRPTFSPASKTKLDAGEEVIAVHIRGAARAYPIRSMSYHHLVNDVLGGLPIVATY